MKRRCKSCGKTAAVETFAKASVVKGVQYYRHLCVPCYSQSKLPRKKRIREEFYSIKKGLCCEECGEDDYRVLDFDHKDRSTKSFNVGDSIRMGLSLDTIEAEIKKCRVLCANCHRRKTWMENNGV